MGMLYSAEMRLQITSSSGEGDVSGHHILSLFLNLIERANPTLAAELHRDTAVKPFTLSPLLPFRVGRPPARREGENLAFRVTALDEKVFAALADAVWRLSPEASLPLGSVRVRCLGLATIPAQSPWAKFVSCAQLQENAAAETRLRLAFLSPTTFRSKGRRNVMFPEPSLVFGSLLNRWNAVAGTDCWLELPEQALGLVRVSNYRLTTSLLDFGSYQEVGFRGQATFECSDNVAEEHVKTLNTLADFAYYAGIGAKTTMGMGQAGRLTGVGPLSRRARSYLEEAGRHAACDQG